MAAGAKLVSFQREEFFAVAHEFAPLWKEHFKEAGKLRTQPFAPDWPLINRWATSGNYALYTLRDRGVLIGYSLFVVTKLAQHAGRVFALNEALYVIPAYRTGKNVFALLGRAERDLLGMGVHAVRYASVPYVKSRKGGLGKLYKFFGARAVEVLYEKALTAETAGVRGHGRGRNRK